MKNNLKIVFFGTSSFVVSVLEKLRENYQVVGVVTAPDSPVGRKKILTPLPVKQAAKDIPVLTPEKFGPETVQRLKNFQPDLFVVASYGKILSEEILQIPKFGALNIHPSLLPQYRGPSPMPTAILNGDKVSGVTIIKMDEKMDHGPIIYSKEIRLSDQDNFDILSKKMFKEGAESLVKIIPEYISGKIKLQEQDYSKATYTQVMTKENGYFDLSAPPSPEKLDRMIRAYYPWPGVWTHWNGKVVKFYPGNMVQMEGKKPVKLEDFLRGHPNFPIKKLIKTQSQIINSLYGSLKTNIKWDKKRASEAVGKMLAKRYLKTLPKNLRPKNKK